MAACLDSIRRQTSDQWEILLADGASSDGTMAIVEANSDVLAYHHSAPDDGVYDAWNSLIPRARGNWIMFLGADDLLADENVVADLLRYAEELPARYPDLTFIFGTTELIAGGQVIERLGTGPLPDDRQSPADDFSFSHTGLLHRTDLFAEFGVFETRFRIAADGHFMFRAAKDPRTRFHFCDRVVAKMAAGGISTGARSRVQCYREVEEGRRLLGIEPARPSWLSRLQFRSRVIYRIEQTLGPHFLLIIANAYRLLKGKPSRPRYD